MLANKNLMRNCTNTFTALAVFLQEFQWQDISNFLRYCACQIVPHERPSSIKQWGY